MVEPGGLRHAVAGALVALLIAGCRAVSSEEEPEELLPPGGAAHESPVDIWVPDADRPPHPVARDADAVGGPRATSEAPATGPAAEQPRVVRAPQGPPTPGARLVDRRPERSKREPTPGGVG